MHNRSEAVLLRHHRKEIRLLHKELEVLSAQHTDKCLENSQLSQELQTERKSVTQYRKENQELQNKQVQNNNNKKCFILKSEKLETDIMFQLHENQSHDSLHSNSFIQMEV